MSKLDEIRDKAIDLVAEAIDDEDIPAAKRADMALSLLGKQAIKEEKPTASGWFVEKDAEGVETRRFGYEFVPRREVET